MSARSVEEGYNTKLDLEPYDIRVQNILGPTKAIPAHGTTEAVPAGPGTTLADFEGWVNYAKAHNYWLTIVFHEVQVDTTPLCSNPPADSDSDPCIGPFDTTITLFQQMLDYLSTSGVGPDVMTVKQAFSSAESQLHSPVAGTVGIAPTSATTNTVLTATPALFSDPDNDALTYTYQWFLNSKVITDDTTNKLDLSQPGHGDHGDVVTVAVTAVDPAGQQERDRRWHPRHDRQQRTDRGIGCHHAVPAEGRSQVDGDPRRIRRCRRRRVHV